MLIIPRTPSPPPLEDRDITTLSMDELREMQRRMQALRVSEFSSSGDIDANGYRQKQTESFVKIKRERKDDEDEQRPRKAARPSQGDTQLEVDDDGGVRERSTSTLAAREVIEID